MEDTDVKKEPRTITCSKGSVGKWLKSVNCILYCSQFLQAWRGRMWSFAVSMFFIQISPESLQLTATYGLSSGAATLILAPLIGDWVDKNHRLTAARIPLLVQSWCVVGCCVLVILLITFHDWADTVWGGWLVPLWHAVIVITAVVANLARLAIGAVLRRIDLVTKIIAPIITGQIMTYTSLMVGAIFIAVWNFVSWFAEHYLLWKVFQSTVELDRKHVRNSFNDKSNTEHDHRTESDTSEVHALYDTADKSTDVKRDGENINPKKVDNSVVVNSEIEDQQTSISRLKEPCHCCPNICMKLFGPCCTFAKGWRTYVRTTVSQTGVSLALLYLTVLGFDNITAGYAFSQGLTESLLGILMGCGAFVGIVGTFAFTRIRRRVGLERTGLFSFSAQILCLVLCVVSIWTPGSPFDPTDSKGPDCSTAINGSTPSSFSNLSTTQDPGTVNSTDCIDGGLKHYTSVILLLSGIILARFGLWISDLTIVQLFLENVDEEERGIVNGVQTSFNQLMDMLKFAIVVAVPQMRLFGFLIIISFLAVSSAGVVYAFYVKKYRSQSFSLEEQVEAEGLQRKNPPEVPA